MEILIIFLLILLKGIFSMSEIALVSARKSRLESSAKRGDINAKIALDTANQPNRFLSTVQIGITLIGILMGIYSGENITDNLQYTIEKYPAIAHYSHTIAVTIVVICITFFSLVFGELIPKRIGLAYPEKISKIMARPMKALTQVTSPFVWLLTNTGDLFIKFFKIKSTPDNKVTEEEIKQIIQEGTEGGEVQEIEQDIVERVFHLGDRKISSLMTHRNDIVFLDVNYTAEALRKKVSEELHSVYPVMDGDKDNIKGVVFLKDLFTHIDDDHFKLVDYIKEPKFLIENTSAYRALQQFKDTKIHFGMVTDEYGHIQGMVTMNDLLEALVGGADDFYKDDFSFEEREDGSWLIDGHYPFADFLHYFELDELSPDFEFNTLGGLILQELKHIPKPGEKIQWKEFEMEVIDMDGARIDKLLVTKR
ncbi:MAG: HlyC/CorC family transporter [Saprospiraceae bacterium]|nr:HlyC/CorC family transporter [Saprospiraceae bacterium]